jgi:hypothetical protein
VKQKDNMKMRKVAVMLGVLTMFGAAMQTGANPILWDTGLTTVGDQDPHYTLVDGSGQEAVVQAASGVFGQLIGQNAPWVPNPLPAQWISPYAGGSTDPWVNDNADHTYIFQTIAGASGTVSGYWATDNSAKIYVDGVYTGQNIDASQLDAPGYRPLTPFTLTLTQGDVVDFYVLNGDNSGSAYGNPAGLLVSTPDGGMTAGLLGGALIGLHALRRKLSR